MPEVRTSKPSTMARFWDDILGAEYPMHALFKAIQVKDRARRDLALEIVRSPEQVAEAFERTMAAVGDYEVTVPFRAPAPSKGDPVANEGELLTTKDISLRLKPPGKLTPVDASEVPGVGNGDLDLVFLEREPTVTRSMKEARDPGVLEPSVKMKPNLLLAAPDGTIGVGEITVGCDRDLFYAFIQALTGLALIATPAQIRRVFANYVTPQFGLPPGTAPKLDIILLTVPRDPSVPERFLTQLDVLARGFIPALLAQPAVAAVIRQVVGITTSLLGEELVLRGSWMERPALG